jgi:hypothetical protein
MELKSREDVDSFVLNLAPIFSSEMCVAVGGRLLREIEERGLVSDDGVKKSVEATIESMLGDSNGASRNVALLAVALIVAGAVAYVGFKWAYEQMGE